MSSTTQFATLVSFPAFKSVAASLLTFVRRRSGLSAMSTTFPISLTQTGSLDEDEACLWIRPLPPSRSTGCIPRSASLSQTSGHIDRCPSDPKTVARVGDTDQRYSSLHCSPHDFGYRIVGTRTSHE